MGQLFTAFEVSVDLFAGFFFCFYDATGNPCARLYCHYVTQAANPLNVGETSATRQSQGFITQMDFISFKQKTGD